MFIEVIIWDLDDEPDGNVQHIEEHGVTVEEAEEILLDPRSGGVELGANGRKNGHGSRRDPEAGDGGAHQPYGRHNQPLLAGPRQAAGNPRRGCGLACDLWRMGLRGSAPLLLPSPARLVS